MFSQRSCVEYVGGVTKTTEKTERDLLLNHAVVPHHFLRFLLTAYCPSSSLIITIGPPSRWSFSRTSATYWLNFLMPSARMRCFASRIIRGSIETVVRATRLSNSASLTRTVIGPLSLLDRVRRGVSLAGKRRTSRSHSVSRLRGRNPTALAAWRSSSAQLFRGFVLVSFATESNTASHDLSN